MSKMRNICFTINNPEEMLDPELWPTLKYCVYQHEVGEEGTDHFQGYAEFGAPYSLLWFKRLAGLERAHIEVRRGTGAQAANYCTKEEGRLDGPWEWGEMKEQGKRSDLEMIRKKIEDKVPMKRIAMDHYSSWCRYHKSFDKYRLMCQAPRDWPMELVFLLGPTRTGKSRTAKRMAGDDVYYKPPGPWWDNYEGQHTIIWDEFYGHSYKFTELLQVLDRYPLLVPYKGGFYQFVSKRIIFTSNQEPENWYSGERTHQVVWADNPLNARIREFGQILRTGEIHQAVARVEQTARVTFDEATGNWSDALAGDLN